MSLGDCWNHESFLSAGKHLFRGVQPTIETYDIELVDNEKLVVDMLQQTTFLCIATQLKDEQEIKGLRNLVDLAFKKEDCYVAILLCNSESRNPLQESVVEYLKFHTNIIVDLERFHLLPDCQISEVASFVVQGLFACFNFPSLSPYNCCSTLDDLKGGIKGGDVAFAAIFKEDIDISARDRDEHEKKIKSIKSTIIKKMSEQQINISQASHIYLAMFYNLSVIDMTNIPVDISIAELACYYPQTLGIKYGFHDGVVRIVPDETMKDGEVLFVAIVSGFGGQKNGANKIKLTKLEFVDDNIDDCILASFDDGWDCESFLGSIKHLLPEVANLTECDIEITEEDIEEENSNDILWKTKHLFIVTQLKDVQEIEKVQALVDFASVNRVYYTAVLLCNSESRNPRQERAVEYLKIHTNTVIDLERCNSLCHWQAIDAASFVVKSIFAAVVFPNSLPEERGFLYLNNVLYGFNYAAIVNVDDIGDSQKVKEISQATAEQMSRQGNDLSQSHSVCVVVFGNHETLKEQLLDEVAMEIYGRVEEDKRVIHKGVIDDTMKDGELLVVTLALASEIKKSYRVYVRETDDDKYQKRFEEMRSMFTAPGLVALTDKKVNWFSELGGFAFIGEAEAAGDNAAMNATASLMSSWMLSTRNYWQLETGDFKDTASFLVHILGSSKVVDMRTEGDVKSVIRETSTDSTCTIGVHLDDNMGEKVRITLVSLITY